MEVKGIMEIIINGDKIETVYDFHYAFSSVLGIERVYGNNLHALWDVLSAGVERPVILRWKNSEISKSKLGKDFEGIIEVLRRVERQDEEFGWSDKFSFALE